MGTTTPYIIDSTSCGTFSNATSYEFLTDDGSGRSTTDFMDFTNFFKQQTDDKWSISVWVKRATQFFGWSGTVFNNSSTLVAAGNDGIWVSFFQTLSPANAFNMQVSFDGVVSGENMDATSTGGLLPINTWKNYVITYGGGNDANNFNFYQDGVLMSKSVINNNPATIPYNSAKAGIGSHPTLADAGTEINTKFDEISFWNIELSLAEVQEIYNSGTAANLCSHSQNTGSNLEAWYRIDNDTVNAGNTVTDEQGNHDGAYSAGTAPANAAADAP